MEIALVSAAASTSASTFARLLVVVVLLGIGYPLTRRLRRTASERRKRRWVEEGLMDPPAADPDATKPSK